MMIKNIDVYELFQGSCRDIVKDENFIALKASIAKNGQLVPVTVCRTTAGYEVIDGWRRVVAMRCLAKRFVLCKIIILSDGDIKNIQIMKSEPYRRTSDENYKPNSPQQDACSPQPQSIIRLGWDNITIDNRTAYLRGDIVVSYTGKWWTINHPVLNLFYLSFSSANEAMEAAETWLNFGKS